MHGSGGVETGGGSDLRDFVRGSERVLEEDGCFE